MASVAVADTRDAQGRTEIRVVRRKPPLRVHLPRLSENEKRDLSLDEPDEAARTALAGRARYEGYGKHKRNLHLWNLAAFHGYAPDRTFCEDVGFERRDEQRIPVLLHRGIAAGLFGDLHRQGDPTMLWTIDDNGWIYEMRQTNSGQALYHGYPMAPTNALGRKVIARFETWIFSFPREERDPALLAALRDAQDRYS
ncbi:hypothetical protein [Sphingomonas sp. ID0503]|uniref:hypothetical protein n=1 Tax=Sphingomonas sp. ID0503 TaxID=3399691 RepID=UPI003AFB81CF